MKTSAITSAPAPGPVDPIINYRDAAGDFPGTGQNDQSSNVNFDKTWAVGERKTDGHVIIDKGAGYEYSELTLTPDGSGASASGSNDMVNWTTIAGIPDGKFVGYRYIWPQSTLAAYGGGVTYTSMTEGGINLAFESPNPDLKFFRPGDAVKKDPGYLSGPYVAESTQPAARGGDWSNVFNGVIGTTGADTDLVTPSLKGEKCVFTPSTPIRVTDSVKLYSLNEFEGAIVLNDGVTYPATGAYGTESIITAADLGGC